MIARYSFVWAFGGNYHKVELYNDMDALEQGEIMHTMSESRATLLQKQLRCSGKITPIQMRELKNWMRIENRMDTAVFITPEGGRLQNWI
jgi:hypothetical protein